VWRLISSHQGYKPRSIRRKVASVKAFCGYLEHEELLFATGIRVSELCALRPGDARLSEGEVKIYGKGAKERFVQVANPSVLQALQEYRTAFATPIA